MSELYDRLKKLNPHTRYPFHMPGHKRNPGAGPLAEVMALDITEIDGFDDLHDADGILREAQRRAAGLYGAEETHFLVNGSTAGILAAVSAVCADAKTREGGAPAGGVMLPHMAETGNGPLLLAGRNSHQSFLHAAYLNRADVMWLWEEQRIEGSAAISGTVYPAEVMDALTRGMQEKRLPAAVFVTSPTYYGVVADVPSIVEIAHSFGVPVIVDEAHGAHFGFGHGMPDSAIHAGADLVVGSVHKTLPSLTQTALIHAQGRLIDREKLRRFLRIYQTSSPSYVLMASIDACMAQIEEKPEELFAKPVLYKQIILQQSAKWRMLRVLSDRIVRDPCKVVVSTADTPMTGRELYDTLLENYSIQPEMAGRDEVVFILTGMDTESGLEALLWSLTAIDGYLADGSLARRVRGEKASPPTPHPEEVCPIADAWDAPAQELALCEAAGRICAEPVIPYPPGTPLLVPGERLDDVAIACIQSLLLAGDKLRGITQREGETRIRVLA